MWFITNGPVGKGGDIHGDVIKEMAVEPTNDPRFEVSNGLFERFKKWYNIKQYTHQGDGALILEFNVWVILIH